MSNNAELLQKALRERIVIIDGAMGTTIRTYGLGEAEIRGERFKDSKKDLKNNGDLYSLTQAATICDIHRRFSKPARTSSRRILFPPRASARANFSWTIRVNTAGAKTRHFTKASSKTNFSTTSPGKSTSNPPSNAANGRDRIANKTGRPRFVAGAIGPLTVSLSNSPDADDAGFRVCTFDQVKTAYAQPSPRTHRGRLGHFAGRNDFRFAQRQGCARGDSGSL